MKSNLSVLVDEIKGREYTQGEELRLFWGFLGALQYYSSKNQGFDVRITSILETALDATLPPRRTS